MLLIYGKNKVGSAVAGLCDHLGLTYEMRDDRDAPSSYDAYKMIIPSPGIPSHHPIYATGKILAELDFAYRYLPKGFQIISITGTDGKSTTAWIMYNILDKEYSVKNSSIPQSPESGDLETGSGGQGKSVYLSGNFDIPFSQTVLDILRTGEKKGIIVVEVSSFMAYALRGSFLGGFTSDYSIFTNFKPDHLNWHRDLQDYLDAKMNLMRYTRTRVIMNDQVIDFAEDNGLKFDSLEKVRIFTQRMDGSVPRNDEQKSLGMTKKRDYTDGENIVLSGRKKYRLSETQFSGLHNAMNILSVAMVADEMRIPVERIGKYLSEIGGLLHRLELVGERQGIQFIDDSKSTSSQSLVAALSAFPHEQTILIAGGSDKGDPFNSLENSLVGLKYAVLIGATRDRLAKKCEKAGVQYIFAESMESAVEYAHIQAVEGDTILLSPGCASFGLFRDYLDRANQFRTALEKIPK